MILFEEEYCLLGHDKVFNLGLSCCVSFSFWVKILCSCQHCSILLVRSKASCWFTVRQGPIVLTAGDRRGIFCLLSLFCLLVWKMTLYWKIVKTKPTKTTRFILALKNMRLLFQIRRLVLYQQNGDRALTVHKWGTVDIPVFIILHKICILLVNNEQFGLSPKSSNRPKLILI